VKLRYFGGRPYGALRPTLLKRCGRYVRRRRGQIPRWLSPRTPAATTGRVTEENAMIQRMNHVGIVVDDLAPVTETGNERNDQPAGPHPGTM